MTQPSKKPQEQSIISKSTIKTYDKYGKLISYYKRGVDGKWKSVPIPK